MENIIHPFQFIVSQNKCCTWAATNDSILYILALVSGVWPCRVVFKKLTTLSVHVIPTLLAMGSEELEDLLAADTSGVLRCFLDSVIYTQVSES